eukprot:TRINITY_DN14182_c0_g1_i1.p1 TRINITY_DN14182_c0_g1~~TRINITY_DN14182_c0_g1_i1.p1  ORF type:complete len:210 (+),score=23.68 TRINITY_DN14182_c0_g1_i1:74-631(+)
MSSGDKLSWYKHREWKPGDDAVEVTAPKKIDNEKDVKASPTGVGSAWNAAGTWEEQGQKAWAVERLTTLLVGVEHSGAVVKEVTITGDASINFIRGKKKYPYDFSLEFKIHDCDDSDTKCEVKISDFACDETAPYEMEFSWKGDNKKQEFKDTVGATSKQVRSGEGLLAKIHEVLESWVEEFKQK